MRSFLTPRRVTGLLYLALAVTGLLSYLVIRSQLFAAGEAAATLENLATSPALARWGVALELGVVLFQALLAVSFFALFRPVRPVAAVAIAAFGLLNAAAILVATMMWSVAIDVAAVAAAPGADAASTVLLLFTLHDAAWSAGNLFFGLWLIPMGLAALAAGWVRPLGWALIIGGLSYVVSAFLTVLAPGLAPLAEGLALVATVGEFWMIGYLLFTRGRAADPVQNSSEQTASISA